MVGSSDWRIFAGLFSATFWSARLGGNALFYNPNKSKSPADEALLPCQHDAAQDQLFFALPLPPGLQARAVTAQDQAFTPCCVQPIFLLPASL